MKSFLHFNIKRSIISLFLIFCFAACVYYMTRMFPNYLKQQLASHGISVKNMSLNHIDEFCYEEAGRKTYLIRNVNIRRSWTKPCVSVEEIVYDNNCLHSNDSASTNIFHVLSEVPGWLCEIIHRSEISIKNIKIGAICALSDITYRAGEGKVKCWYGLDRQFTMRFSYKQRVWHAYIDFVMRDVMSAHARLSSTDLLAAISIDLLSIKWKNYDICGNGNISCIDQNCTLNIPINFIEIPEELKRVVYADLNDLNVVVQLQMNKPFSMHVRRGSDQLGTITYQYGSMLEGDIGWLNIGGHQLQTISVIHNEDNVDLLLRGDDFTLSSKVDLDAASITQLTLDSSKGKVNLTKPINLNKIDCVSFDFNFSQLDFWKQMIPISGAGSGHVEYCSGNIIGKASSSKLVYNDSIVLHDIDLQKDSSSIHIACKMIESSVGKLLSVKAQATNERWIVQGKSEQKLALWLTGTIEGDKIMLNRGSYGNEKQRLMLRNVTCDYRNKLLKGTIDLLSKKKGQVVFCYDSGKVDGNCRNISLAELGHIFDRKYPIGVLNGSWKLHLEDGRWVGKADFICTGCGAKKNVINLSSELSNNNIKISGYLKGKTSLLNICFAYPLSLSRACSLLGTNSDVSCSLSGNVRLQDVLELPDRRNLRGDVNCDIKITGSLQNPKLTGYARWNGAHISVGDILLTNGAIELSGNDHVINVKKAYFQDKYGGKAQATGEGRFFWDGMIPNIDASLDIKFDRFYLLNGETIKGQLTGHGKMFGPINDMSLTGEVDVLRAKMSYENDDTVEIDQTLVVENDIHMQPAQKQELSSEFFTYNILMHCKRINVIGNMFDISLMGDLRLLSNQDKCSTLAGSLRLDKGHLDLFGKRMRFVSGAVTFLEEFPYLPKIHLTGRRNFGNIMINIDVRSSPIKGSSLSLSSNPPCTQDVIIAQLLFGKEPQQLSVMEAAQLAHVAASLKRQGYLFSLLNSFRNLGIIDTISFSSVNENNGLYQNNRNASNKLKISAGKYLSDNIYISVNKKDENTTLDVDLSLSPTISVKANTAGEVGLSWKHRY